MRPTRTFRTFRALLVAGIALAAASPSPARAELYAAISGGVFIPTGTSPYGAIETRPTAALAIGYDLDYVGASVWAGFFTTSAGVLLVNTSFPVVLRIRGRLPLGVVAPYAFGGVGFAPSRTLLDMVQNDAVAFTAQAGGGADFQVADLFTVGVEGFYEWLRPSYWFGTVDLNSVMVLATFALRFP
jgi:hypothetical protein